MSFGEFARPSRRQFVNQAGHALEEVLISVIANGLLTETQHGRYFADALPLSEGQQSMDAFDQFQGAVGIGLLEVSIELFAGKRAELLGRGHERYLLRMESITTARPHEFLAPQDAGLMSTAYLLATGTSPPPPSTSRTSIFVMWDPMCSLYAARSGGYVKNPLLKLLGNAFTHHLRVPGKDAVQRVPD